MGLFDFLKKKPGDEPAATPPAAPQQAAPAAAPTEGAPAPAAKPEGGPRYQRPAFAAQNAAQMQPSLAAAAGIPPMPPMPEPPPLPFEPSNNLEQVLLLAAQDPQYRLAFYHELLQGQLIVLTNPVEGQEPGEVTVAEGTEVQLHVLHDGRIPVFSSEARIYDGGTVQGEVSFLRVPGEGFFRMTQGAECVLNPFSPFGKLLVAPEIDDLLSGRIFSQPAEGEQPEGPQAQLVPLADVPEPLTAALQEFCGRHAHIEAAYLAGVVIEGDEAPSRLLLAFSVDGEDMDFLQELGPVVQEHLQQDAIDVARLSPDPNEPLTHFFSQQEPLYRRVQA